MNTEDLAVVAALAVGIVLVAAGAALVYVPAGPIAAGALLLGLALGYVRGLAK